jgi:NAD+ synthase
VPDQLHLTDALRLDPEAELGRIERFLRVSVAERLGRRGAVVGMSGGLDSSVTAALCARALGAERVLGVLMPERESSAESAALAAEVADAVGIETVVEEITGTLEAAGAYARRDAAVAGLVPEFGPGWRSKIVLPSLLDDATLRVPFLVVESPGGDRLRVRVTAAAYRAIVASTNFKQRVRKMIEYFHADRLEYAVVGTPNLLEVDQGFFVKNGDGSADVKPIAHLFKSQVLELARHLELPAGVVEREPTTDTYSLAQDQEEFFFSLPLEKLDLCLFAVDRDLEPADVAGVLDLTADEVARVYDDIARKRAHAAYLSAPALVLREDP